MALTTDARQEIADALNAAGILTFPVVPETLTMPSVVIVPGEPYVLPDRIGPTLAYTASYDLTCVAQAADNAAGLAAVEGMIDAVLAALPDGIRCERVTRPALDDFGAQGAGYVAQIFVTGHLAGAAPTPPPPIDVPAPPGEPYADNWLETGGGWQYDLHWDLSPDDGGSPILEHLVSQTGQGSTIVDGNTGFLGAQFSLTYPREVWVQAYNVVGLSLPSPTATLTPPI